MKERKNNHTQEKKPPNGIISKKTNIDTKGDVNRNSGGPDKFADGNARSNFEQWTPKKTQNNNNAIHTTITSNKNNNKENGKEREVSPGRNVIETVPQKWSWCKTQWMGEEKINQGIATKTTHYPHQMKTAKPKIIMKKKQIPTEM